MIFIVALLMKALATEFADVRSIPQMDSHVGIEGGAAVKSLAAGLTFVWLLRCVDDFVSAKS